MSKKTWKDHLLSSGLPLEQSVIEVLKEHKFLTPKEFRYERQNEIGIATVFSVDVLAAYHFAKHISGMRLSLELLIECKYRHDSTRWIFNPEEYEWFGRAEFSESFTVVDEVIHDREVDRGCLNKFGDKYPLCSKGIEILENDSNPKSIDQAISQLAYALPLLRVDAVNQNSGGGEPTIRIVLPIVVTTSELWRLRPKVKVSDVRRAEKLDAVAEKVETLVVHRRPDNDLARYTSEQLDRSVNSMGKTRVGGWWHGGFEGYNRFVSANSPSMYIVVYYERFQKVVGELLAFLTSEKLVVAKKAKVG